MRTILVTAAILCLCSIPAAAQTIQHPTLEARGKDGWTAVKLMCVRALVTTREESPRSKTYADFAFSLSHESQGGFLRWEHEVTPEKETVRVVWKAVGWRKEDLRLTHPVIFPGSPKEWTLPKWNGCVVSTSAGEPLKASYELGAGSVEKGGVKLALPVLDACFSDGSRLAVAADPYCGVQFQSTGDGINLVTVYPASSAPIKEDRRIVLTSHSRGVEGTLESFYDTIPEIKPGPAWQHKIQMVYYDYLSDGGQGWYNDLEALAKRIPKEQRDCFVGVIHGWYDYIGRYTYDADTGKLDKEWIAFPRTRKTSMSKSEMHKRIAFARERGFRVLLYFGDGVLSDSGMEHHRGEWTFVSSKSAKVNGWEGPDTWGRTYAMDVSHPQVRAWFLGYMDALLREYGDELDGFVWDETNYITLNHVSPAASGDFQVDRAMMSLVSGLTQRVQKKHDGLSFLTSDMIGFSLKKRDRFRTPPYCLVAHGTYQDSWCFPDVWPYSFLPNYRNTLWSCLWWPVTQNARRRYAADELGLPQSLSNGWEDDKGPSEMPPEMLDDVIKRFDRRVKEGGRVIYLLDGSDTKVWRR